MDARSVIWRLNCCRTVPPSASYLAELVVWEGLVELSGEVRDVLLVTVVQVAGGPDSQFTLGDVNALLECDLRALRGLLMERQG